MHHTMTVAAPPRTVTTRWPAVAVKTDVKTGHDIAYVTRGHASGCTGAMAYYTRAGDPREHGKAAAAPLWASQEQWRPRSPRGSTKKEPARAGSGSSATPRRRATRTRPRPGPPR